MKTLVLGGVKSGKSRFAERQAARWLAQTGSAQSSVMYLATAENRADDKEFSRRIVQHRAQRPASWKTVEEPLDIAAIIARASGTGQCVLVECLTLWLSNLLAVDDAPEAHIDRLCSMLEVYQGELILVSNETGLGIMPANALARRFGDQLGLLHQRLAGLCDEVVLMVAGLPQYLKQNKE